jgi:hypothetical protein
MPKYYADLHFWFDKPKVIEIQKEDIDNIVAAVEGQYTFVNNKTGLAIKGETVAYVNIHEVKEEDTNE